MVMNTANCADTLMSESSNMIRGMPARIAFCSVMICTKRHDQRRPTQHATFGNGQGKACPTTACYVVATHLLRDDGQHLNVDTVELVEARPGTAGRETLEELAHGQVVQTIGAVEHDALLRKRLGQVLDGLGLQNTTHTMNKYTTTQSKHNCSRTTGRKTVTSSFPYTPTWRHSPQCRRHPTHTRAQTSAAVPCPYRRGRRVRHPGPLAARP